MEIKIFKDEFLSFKLPLIESLKLYSVTYPPSKDVKTEKGIYFLFDEDKVLLYVGRSNNIRCRLSQHISPFNKNRYELGKDQGYINSWIPKGVVKFFSFCNIEDSFRLGLLENIYTFAYNPLFNRDNLTKITKDYLMKKYIPDVYRRGLDE